MIERKDGNWNFLIVVFWYECYTRTPSMKRSRNLEEHIIFFDYSYTM